MVLWHNTGACFGNTSFWWCRLGGVGGVTVTPAVTVKRDDLCILPPELWERVQARLKEWAEAYLRQTGGRFYGRPELSRESRYLFSGFLRCSQCGSAIVVGRRTHNPPHSWYACSLRTASASPWMTSMRPCSMRSSKKCSPRRH